MADTYKVKLVDPLGFPADQRVRSGVLVTKADGYEGELTDEQLEAIKNDEHLVVSKVQVTAPKSDKKTASAK